MVNHLHVSLQNVRIFNAISRIIIFPGRGELVRVLIEFGANVNAEDIEKITPLHWAASNGKSFPYLYWKYFFSSEFLSI